MKNEKIYHIVFPNLNLSFELSPDIISIGNISIKWYGVILAAPFLCAFIYIFYKSNDFGIKTENIYDLTFASAIPAILGARLYYVIFNFSYYSHNLLEIFAIWNGGLAIHGGIIAGVLTVIFFAKKYHLNFLKLLDMAAPSLILAQAIGRWGNFFNGEAHGIATSYSQLKDLWIPEFIIDGMNIGGIYYLPTFYFESLWCLLGFVVLILIKKYKYIKIGATTCIYLMWYSLGRFFIEAWRTDSLMIGGFKVAQIISIALFVAGLIYLIYLSRKGKYENLYNDINEKRVVKKGAKKNV